MSINKNAYIKKKYTRLSFLKPLYQKDENKMFIFFNPHILILTGDEDELFVLTFIVIFQKFSEARNNIEQKWKIQFTLLV